jgi:hypothetical protein
MVKKKILLKRGHSRISKRNINHKPHITQTSSEVRVEKILIENFVSLQKVMVNLSVKFDNLANQISRLLELFEKSARTLTEEDFSSEKNNNKKIMEKMDNLFEQNKTIAKGLTLMHGKTSEQNYPVKKPVQAPTPEQGMNIGEYQKSISSENPESPSTSNDNLTESQNDFSESTPQKFKSLPQ